MHVLALLYLFGLISAAAWWSSNTGDDFELVEADVRNIIFVGRSRAGKSTIIEVLKNKNYEPPLFEVLRGTKVASLDSFTMNSESLNKNIHFNIMDTPGVFERTEGDDRRTNEVIVDLILKCIDMEITKIHHVYFVMSIQTGLNVEDLKAFELFTELFVGMENKISIVLSFAQDVSSDHDYDHYLKQFRKVPELNILYRRINGSVHFLGATKRSSTSNVEKLRENVHKQRSSLLKHILQQKESFNVKQLNVYRERQQSIKRMREFVHSLCGELSDKCDNDELETFDAVITRYIANIDDCIGDDMEEKPPQTPSAPPSLPVSPSNKSKAILVSSEPRKQSKQRHDKYVSAVKRDL
mmetsp:Transcript_8594/g.14132  ORF Transcript_8594/g.14132 Transcript_8594/m.14132 type:complete len:354 (+) Transcript_8594:63-1124(+)